MATTLSSGLSMYTSNPVKSSALWALTVQERQRCYDCSGDFCARTLDACPYLAEHPISNRYGFACAQAISQNRSASTTG